MANLLFYCKAPMNAVMFARPLRELYSNPRFSIRFTGYGRSHGDSIAILNSLGFQNAQPASAVATRWRAWDAFVSPDIHMPARRAKRRIQIFHGVSFKGKMFTPAIHRFSDLFLVGDDMRRRFIARGLYTDADPALHNIGMPKLDAFFDGSLDRKKILTELGADPTKPAVLYAPTWRPESSLYANGGLDFIKQCSAGNFSSSAPDRHAGDMPVLFSATSAVKPSSSPERGRPTPSGDSSIPIPHSAFRIPHSLPPELPFTLIVKLHDWHWDPNTNPIDWRAAIPQLQNQNVRFATGPDSTPYLFAADALISDASSVANEYLLLNRPILWLDAPKLIKKYEQTIDLDGWGRKTGHLIKNAMDLTEAIPHALNNPQEHAEIRQQAAADIFYNPGQATQNFLKTLNDLMIN